MVPRNKGRAAWRGDLKSGEVSEIRRLARAGKSSESIADEVVRSYSTVRVYSGRRYSNKRPKYDLVKLVRSYERTESTQERAELAERLGFPSLPAMRSMVCYARAHMRAKGIEWRLPGEASPRMGLKPRTPGGFGYRGTSGSSAGSASKAGAASQPR